jgi:hypothetical protein
VTTCTRIVLPVWPCSLAAAIEVTMRHRALIVAGDVIENLPDLLNQIRPGLSLIVA